jgi:hypothetical protein
MKLLIKNIFIQFTAALNILKKNPKKIRNKSQDFCPISGHPVI